MNILLSCDEKYIRYASVLLESVFENNDVPVHVFLVYNDPFDEKYLKLKEYVNVQWNQTIDICDYKQLKIDILKTDNHFPLECYYTLFPHLYLPENVDRVLYLDIDTIVDRNLKDFYDQDFEGNYLIACGQRQGFKKSDQMNNPGKFGYFNSGVILYNIEKMRKDISFDHYQFVLSHSDEFFFDQGMLNYLFYKDTKYAETLLYNFRSYIAFRLYREKALELTHKREVYIYHYTCNGIPYKPWDFFIEDDSFFDSYKSSPFENSFFYISKEVNETIKIWWEYAKKSPFFAELHDEMVAKRNYIFFFNISKRINKLSGRIISLIKNVGAVRERQKKISYLQNSKKTTYLEAVNNYYGIDNNGTNNNFQKISNINDYFELLKITNNVLLIISCKENCDKYFDIFTEKSCLGLNKPSFRESYIAVISKSEVINEIRSCEEIKYFFEYGNNDIQKGLIISRGFDPKSLTSISEIVINNIDYSLNKIGLNCVLIDTDNNIVIDSFNVNTHADKDLKMLRVQ